MTTPDEVRRNVATEQTRATVMDAMVELWGIDRAKIIPEAMLGRDLGADSLDLVELIMDVEERLNIEIPDAAISGRHCDYSVKDVFDLVEKHVDEQRSQAA